MRINKICRMVFVSNILCIPIERNEPTLNNIQILVCPFVVQFMKSRLPRRERNVHRNIEINLKFCIEP